MSKITKQQLQEQAHGLSATVEYQRGKGWLLKQDGLIVLIGKNSNEALEWFAGQIEYCDDDDNAGELYDLAFAHLKPSIPTPKQSLLSANNAGFTCSYLQQTLEEDLISIQWDGDIVLNPLPHSSLKKRQTWVESVDKFIFEVGMRIVVPTDLHRGFQPLGSESVVTRIGNKGIRTSRGDFTYDQILVDSTANQESYNTHPIFDIAFARLAKSTSVVKIQQNKVVNFALYKGRQSETANPIGDPIGDPLATHNIFAVKDKDWISPKQFSVLVNISERKAQQALANAVGGKKWRNNELQVKRLENERGGNSGLRYELYVPSLPADLKAKWYAQFLSDSRVPQVPTSMTAGSTDKDKTLLKSIDDKYEIAQWRYNIIKRALAYPPHSKERSEMINQIALQKHVKPDGTTVQLNRSTLYNWLKVYGNGVKIGGLPALLRKQRNDTNVERVLISRIWDKAFAHLENKDQISSALTNYIRSLWANGCPSWRNVLRFAENQLCELTRPYARDLHEKSLSKLCVLSRTKIEREKQYQLIAIHEQDAKLYFDKYLPRIKRDRAGIFPMDIIVGDVHPVDIGVRRDDGSIAYARAVAWQDVATNRLWLTLVLLEKHEGVRREHVAMSFASMCQSWGLPKKIYLDNGSEYNWSEMIKGFTELAYLAQTDFTVMYLDDNPELRAVVRSRPYNAPAKPIEGLFSVLEQKYFKMIPGWVGGNRMKKKTHNVGKEPEPFPGTWDEFHAAIDTALALYHTQPQQGTLAGRSPYESLQNYIETGWGKTAIGYTELLLAFCEEETRTVYAGGYVLWNKTWYQHDRLLPYSNQKITVRYPKHDPRFVFAFTGRKLLCTAPLAVRYGFLDRAGAKEQSRRAGKLRRYIACLKRNCDRLDLVAISQQEENKHTMPVPTSQREIVSTELQQMLCSLEQATVTLLDNAATKQQQEVSQWHSAAEINPLLANLVIEDDEEEVGGLAK